MVSIEYANAYSEVLELLKYISKSDYDKVPNDIIELFNSNHNKNYIFEYDMKKTLEEQDVSEIAKTIIAMLFRDYWATDEQKQKIIEYQKNQKINIEKEKTQKYNCDNIFKNKESKPVQKNENNVYMIKYKKSIFTKIINKLKEFFK